jgi:hypothetical protein
VLCLYRRRKCLPIEKERLWISLPCSLLVHEAFACAILPTYVLVGLQGYLVLMPLIGSPKVSTWKWEELDRLRLLNITVNVY